MVFIVSIQVASYNALLKDPNNPRAAIETLTGCRQASGTTHVIWPIGSTYVGKVKPKRVFTHRESKVCYFVSNLFIISGPRFFRRSLILPGVRPGTMRAREPANMK